MGAIKFGGNQSLGLAVTVMDYVLHTRGWHLRLLSVNSKSERGTPTATWGALDSVTGIGVHSIPFAQLTLLGRNTWQNWRRGSQCAVSKMICPKKMVEILWTQNPSPGAVPGINLTAPALDSLQPLARPLVSWRPPCTNCLGLLRRRRPRPQNSPH